MGGTDIRGISVINGGIFEMSGHCSMDSFVSSFGDVLGIHLMDDSELWIDDGADTRVLIENGDGIYPNNFYACNLKTESLKNRRWESYPYDYIKGVFDHSGNGYIFPKGVLKSDCKV